MMWRSVRLLQRGGFAPIRRSHSPQIAYSSLSRPVQTPCCCRHANIRSSVAVRSFWLSRRQRGMAASGASTQHAHTNRLIDEESPYLLQHAHNPVRGWFTIDTFQRWQVSRLCYHRWPLPCPARHGHPGQPESMPACLTCRWTGFHGAKRPSRRPESSTGRSSCQWATAPATGKLCSSLLTHHAVLPLCVSRYARLHTCARCHVMERESFESEETARLMNEHFVNIKVDKEERSDVDRVHMTYVQVLDLCPSFPSCIDILLLCIMHA